MKSIDRKSTILAIIAVLIAMLSIQSGASLAKQLFPIVGPMGATALRLFFASLVLVIIFRPWQNRPARRSWKSIALYGISLGAMNILFYLSIQKIPLGLAVALEFTGPLGVALLASKKKLDLLWAVLAIIGIICILPVTDSSSSVDPWGVFFALAAGLFWAGYILFGQKAGDDLKGGIAVTWGMLVATLITVPIGFGSAGAMLFVGHIIPLGIAVGILSSALPYSLEMIALKRLPTKTFSILMSLEPGIAALSGFIFLREELTFVQWIALLVVVTASIGSILTSKKKGLLPDTVNPA